MEKIIYIAGGCFWGVEEYFSQLKGINKTEVGYANGKTINPTYQEVKSHLTGHAETVKIIYEDKIISLEKILEHYLRFVDPYSKDKQGEDIGNQYRTGVYYIDENDKDIIESYLNKKLSKGYLIEILPLSSFYKGEEYHQNYLKKNPTGYCHINLNLIKEDEKK